MDRKAGTFIYEPAGEAHTLVITDDSPEPAIIFFVIHGALVYPDKPVNGTLAAFEDGFSALELSRKFYREAGLDVGKLNLRIRQTHGNEYIGTGDHRVRGSDVETGWLRKRKWGISCLQAPPTLNIGVVLYSKGNVPGTLNARWTYQNIYSGKG